MSALQIILLVGYAIGMSLGQILFKTAALTMSTAAVAPVSLVGWAIRLALNPYFVAAAFIYLGLSALWVWTLSFTPLSKAYPFVALAFIATPLIGKILFSEPVGDYFYVGMTLVVMGLILIIR